MTGSPAIVEARGLVKRYNGTVAVAGVDLTIPEGEIFGLVGPNGAGKTTMLRMLATLLEPTSGDARIAGESVTRNPQAVRRVLGYMPDAFGVYDDMKVIEYLEFFAAAYGVTERSAAKKDPRRTGLDALRTSRRGLHQATGNLWVWGHDGHPDSPRASLFGGSWISGDDAGSRYAYVGYGWPGSSDGDLGARGRCDHLQPA